MVKVDARQRGFVMGADDVSRLWEISKETRDDVKKLFELMGEMSGDIKAITAKLESGDRKFEKMEVRLAAAEEAKVNRRECEKRHDAKWRIIGAIFTGLGVAAAWSAVVFAAVQ